jgi:hypothetical protein
MAEEVKNTESPAVAASAAEEKKPDRHCGQGERLLYVRRRC